MSPSAFEILREKMQVTLTLVTSSEGCAPRHTKSPNCVHKVSKIEDVFTPITFRWSPILSCLVSCLTRQYFGSIHRACSLKVSESSQHKRNHKVKGSPRLYGAKIVKRTLLLTSKSPFYTTPSKIELTAWPSRLTLPSGKHCAHTTGFRTAMLALCIVPEGADTRNSIKKSQLSAHLLCGQSVRLKSPGTCRASSRSCGGLRLLSGSKFSNREQNERRKSSYDCALTVIYRRFVLHCPSTMR